MSLPDFAAAVLGTGFIGPAHVEALRRVPVPVAGILGSTPEKSRAAAERLALPRAYESLEELLADPEVGAVHVCTPNRVHLPQVTAALSAGKHVLCEKPLAMTSDEARQLVQLARASGKHAAVNYQYRFYPLAREARERVAAGGVGEVLAVTGGYFQDWLLKPTDYTWRVLAEEGGELRAVGDIGTHWLDMITYVTGLEIEAVCADLRTFFPVRYRPAAGRETFAGGAEAGEPVRIDTEDFASVLLRFNGGARGVFTVSQVTAGRKNALRFEISGSQGALAFDGENPNDLWVGHRDAPNECLMRDPSLLHPAASRLAVYPGGHPEGYADAMTQLFRAFYGAIAGDPDWTPTQYPTFEDGLREIVYCEAIARSHREERWAAVEE